MMSVQKFGDVTITFLKGAADIKKHSTGLLELGKGKIGGEPFVLLVELPQGVGSRMEELICQSVPKTQHGEVRREVRKIFK